MDFEFDLGYTSNQIELFSIFPYKTNDYKTIYEKRTTGSILFRNT